MQHSEFFDAVTLGPYRLKNRIVLPPLTRQRSARDGDVATDLMAEYYRQRASAGLIVSEGTQIEPRGQGYAWTPGIHT
ncbi:MAG: alkene reductase, partial [Paraburkholderia tropica]